MVVRFGFPTRGELAERTIMARLVWSADGQERATAWQEMRFAYADPAACDAELRAGRDPQAMHWVGLHHAERAKRLAAELSRRGDLPGARHMLEAVATRIDEYVGSDPDLKAAASELRRLVETLATRAVDPAAAKEMHYQAHRVSREQADYRGRGPGGAQS